MKTIASLPLRLITSQSQFLKLSLGFLIGNALLILSAKFSLPLLPVPVSLQDITVLFLAYYFGPVLAGSLVLSYLAEGFLGLPVFAGMHAGAAVFLGGTGGYLLGFVLAAFVCGSLLKNKTGFVQKGRVFFLGFALIFACGIAYLTYLYSFTTAVTVGLYPFMTLALVKLLVLNIATQFIKPLK